MDTSTANNQDEPQPNKGPSSEVELYRKRTDAVIKKLYEVWIQVGDITRDYEKNDVGSQLYELDSKIGAIIRRLEEKIKYEEFEDYNGK